MLRWLRNSSSALLGQKWCTKECLPLRRYLRPNRKEDKGRTAAREGWPGHVTPSPVYSIKLTTGDVSQTLDSHEL